jgi:hypothetical protein
MLKDIARVVPIQGWFTHYWRLAYQLLFYRQDLLKRSPL